MEPPLRRSPDLVGETSHKVKFNSFYLERNSTIGGNMKYQF